MRLLDIISGGAYTRHVFNHLHPDMRVASHLARWGVKARSAEARAAQAMFFSRSELEAFVRFAYNDSDMGKLFNLRFRMEDDDGYVGLPGSKSRFSVRDDLELAHRLGVSRENWRVFAVMAGELAARRRQSKLSSFSEAKEAWEMLNHIGEENLIGLISRGVPLLDTSIGFHLRELLDAGIDKTYFKNVSIFLSPGNMRREDFTTEEVIALSDANVPSEYASAFSGVLPRYANREFPIIALFQQGVSTGYAVGLLRAGVDVDTVSQLWNEGVPIEYAIASAA